MLDFDTLLSKPLSRKSYLPLSFARSQTTLTFELSFKITCGEGCLTFQATLTIYICHWLYWIQILDKIHFQDPRLH